ncbi:MAG: hypothetical protein ACOYN5_13365 [Bacteroidales bacterium]
MQAPEQHKSDEHPHPSIESIIRANGYLFPITREQVRAFEGLLERKPELIDNNLPDPMEILRQGKQYRATVIINQTQTMYDENLQRAARNGKNIPDEIKKRMHDDRQKGQTNDN